MPDRVSRSNSEGNAREINTYLFTCLFLDIVEELENGYMKACLGWVSLGRCAVPMLAQYLHTGNEVWQHSRRPMESVLAKYLPAKQNASLREEKWAGFTK